MFKRMSPNAKKRLIAKGRKFARFEFNSRLKEVNKHNRKTIIEIKKSHIKEIKEIFRDAESQKLRAKQVIDEYNEYQKILRSKIQETEDLLTELKTEELESKMIADEISKRSARLSGRKSNLNRIDNEIFTLKKKANF